MNRNGPSQEILLVTPVWNDSVRLDPYGARLAAALADAGLPVRWIIADDGSRRGEHDRLRELKERYERVYPQVELLFSGTHRGKGSVVREAWSKYPDAAWFCFVDADGSVTAPDCIRLLRSALDLQSSVLGIRKRTDQTLLKESWFRGLAHRIYLWLTRILLDMHCGDTQCGVKMIRGDDYRSVSHRLEEDGLAFDSELLYTLKRIGADWVEIPVSWEEKSGGKVRPLRDAFGMVLALLRIRERDW